MVTLLQIIATNTTDCDEDSCAGQQIALLADASMVVLLCRSRLF